jgi:hypothetical protein
VPAPAAVGVLVKEGVAAPRDASPEFAEVRSGRIRDSQFEDWSRKSDAVIASNTIVRFLLAAFGSAQFAVVSPTILS